MPDNNAAQHGTAGAEERHNREMIDRLDEANSSVQVILHDESITSSTDPSDQILTARQMVRAHAYPVLATLSTLSLIAMALLQIPSAIRDHRYNHCIETQIQLRQAPHLNGQDSPGKLLYLKAVEHCEGH